MKKKINRVPKDTRLLNYAGEGNKGKGGQTGKGKTEAASALIWMWVIAKRTNTLKMQEETVAEV